MKTKTLLVTLTALTLLTPTLHAGTLNGGKWKPDNCGSKPATPNIDDSSVEAFNQSVSVLKDWQEQAQAYYSCIAKEGSADNTLIADTANKEQAEHRDTVNAINAAIKAASEKLERK
ncbi:MAG: hypothetical protein CTY18_03835 [Methylomonas sp.]|nr:MAG: hypothetical protein CTY24_14020 [Methylobacter sp.]PPD36515.1 MAG: hypothetical protein CTY18_03835 [Methylomonas sp.]